jgi:predicted permease
MRELIRRDGARGRSVSSLALAANALLAWVDHGRRSLRSGAFFDLRGLRRARPFGVLVVLVVAGAVSVTVAASGFLRGTLLRSPAYPDPERLVFAWGSNASNGQIRDVVSGPVFLDLRRDTSTLESLTALHPGSAVTTRDGRPQVLDSLDVSVDFLRVLGVSPALGRDFGDEHRTSGGPAAVILSHAFWREHLGGDPHVVGTPLTLNRTPHTVLGVAGPELDFLESTQVLLPLREDELLREDRTFYNYWLIGRLAPSVTPGAATRELSTVLSRIAADDPRLGGWSILVERVDEISVAAVRPLLFALACAVLLVVLAAAANLASLNLVRTLARARELYVRAAIGAGRSQIATLVLVETGALAIAGTALGLVFGFALLQWLQEIVPGSIPIPGSAASASAVRGSFDLKTVLSGVAAALLVWLLMNLSAFLEKAVRGLRLVVTAELALATVLLVGAGLLSRAADRLLAVDPGVDPEGLLTFYIGELDEPDPAARARYFREVARRIEQVPGVVRAGATDYAPFQGEDDFMGFRLPDRAPPEPGQSTREEWRRVTEGFFEAAGIAIRRGRGFELEDYDVPPAVAVVNESFSAKYWPSSDAVGKRIRPALSGYGLLEIVGVVEDVPERGPALPPPPTFFVPLHGHPRDNMAIFVRFEGDPLESLEAVREAAWSVDSSQPIDRIFPMTALLESTVALPRLARNLVVQFAAVALALGALGLFGVSSYAVRARRPELGIRLALGATPGKLQRQLVSELVRQGSIGLTLGLLLGVGAADVARALLHGVSPADPWTLAVTAVMVGGAAVLSTYLPARAIARIDPSQSIRAL